ncbi:hypothetical protein H257_02299 [Aphanomyces astaci]|uniref:RNase H type-1 domain-containing protein n=1 Tax=Aphanomyces astaci TaxID=112090 RepID=W4H371_APHAT|nr:hypothetical protein H257_02299 [Aphanomyces astaci]ETV85694.1 hypothetical protein H257_02299 [Aphanomyces astaci]|eukprot:XP_009824166.1 hypothetical protein H257_02299 [Aphanomyces astaci]
MWCLGAIVMPRDCPLLFDYDAHYIASATTNNQAEYVGLLRSLRLALARGFTHLTVYGDSQLLVRQLQGVYRVRNPGLRRSNLTVCTLAATETKRLTFCSSLRRTTAGCTPLSKGQVLVRFPSTCGNVV